MTQSTWFSPKHHHTIILLPSCLTVSTTETGDWKKLTQTTKHKSTPMHAKLFKFLFVGSRDLFSLFLSQRLFLFAHAYLSATFLEHRNVFLSHPSINVTFLLSPSHPPIGHKLRTTFRISLPISGVVKYLLRLFVTMMFSRKFFLQNDLFVFL